MTAPLTPQDQQPPSSDGPAEAKAKVGRELVVGLVVGVAVAVAGVILGLLWIWLAPRVPLVSDGSAVYLKDSEGEQAVGADGWFTLLGLGMGVLCALAVFWRRRSGGVAVVVALGVGGVLASVIAWRLGVALGPTTNVVAHAKQVGANKVFDAPLVLHAKAALLIWPVGSLLGFLTLTSLFTSDPAPAPWPGWGPGQGYGPPPGSGAHWVSSTPAEYSAGAGEPVGGPTVSAESSEGSELSDDGDGDGGTEKPSGADDGGSGPRRDGPGQA